MITTKKEIEGQNSYEVKSRIKISIALSSCPGFFFSIYPEATDQPVFLPFQFPNAWVF